MMLSSAIIVGQVIAFPLGESEAYDQLAQTLIS